MKLVFLDIDGVLNHEIFYRGRSSHIRDKRRPYSEIDRDSVEILNGLIKETDAEIVLSSTWRKGRTVAEMSDILKHQGLVKNLLGFTPICPPPCLRGNEIREWLKDNQKLLPCYFAEFRKYVIFDDDSDFLLWQKDNFIHVDGYCGLSPRNVYHAVRILNQ